MVLIAWPLVVASLHLWGIEVGHGLAGVFAVFFLVGGGLIVLGYWCRTTAAILFIVGLIFALTCLQFWSLDGLQEEIVQRFFVNFMILMGGTVILMLDGGGALSLGDREPTLDYRPGIRNWGALLARLLVGAGFLWHSIWDLIDWSEQVELIQAAGFAFPALLVTLSIIIQGVGALFILTGMWVRWSAAVLACFILFVALTANRFWGPTFHYFIQTGEVVPLERLAAIYWTDRLLNMKFFSDHLGILGTLLLLISSAPGRYVLLRRGR